MTKTQLSLALATASLFASSAQARTEFKTVTGISWELRQPSSSSDPERNQAALNACTQQIAKDVETANLVVNGIAKVSFRNIAITNRYGDWSDTEQSWTGERKHKAGGIVDCSYYQETQLL